MLLLQVLGDRIQLTTDDVLSLQMLPVSIGIHYMNLFLFREVVSLVELTFVLVMEVDVYVEARARASLFVGLGLTLALLVRDIFADMGGQVCSTGIIRAKRSIFPTLSAASAK